MSLGEKSALEHSDPVGPAPKLESLTARADGGPVKARFSDRFDSIDLLRGVVMVLMALDHIRHFLSDSLSFRPTDLAQTDASLFLARWVTHFCAPVFVFLAGTGAFLSMTRGKTKNELALYLLTRGLWLIFLELTVVRSLGWTFNFDYHYTMGGVLWALGWSMISLAGLIYLPVWAIASLGLAMIASHNLLDGVTVKSMSSWGWLWKILHKPGVIEFSPGVHFKVAYPLMPWIGVIAAGYGFGILFTREPDHRRKWMLCIGLALTFGFVILRAANIYGDRHSWSMQKDALFTLFSFVNCSKYPPSLLFLLMTLGPAIIALALFDRRLNAPGRAFVTFGRVPLFFYLIHLPLIHGLAVVFSYVRHGQAQWLFENPRASRELPTQFPAGYGYNLAWICLIWLGVVLILFPACRWFADYKQTRRYAWLGYL